MAAQADVKAALEGDRDDLIRALAAHRLVPTVVDRGGGSSLLGKSASPTVKLEPQSAETGTVDRQTTVRVVDALGLDSEDACRAVAEEVQSHDAWG
jgi:hypothetical protein